jgi:hypothetical protein
LPHRNIVLLFPAWWFCSKNENLQKRLPGQRTGGLISGAVGEVNSWWQKEGGALTDYHLRERAKRRNLPTRTVVRKS